MFCGIDVGTTNTKLLVFDDSFKIVFDGRFKTPIVRDDILGDFLSAETFYTETLKLLSSIPEKFKKQIKGIGISSMGETVFPISKEGQILSNGMMWYNENVMEEFGELMDRIPAVTIFKKTGLWPSWIYSVFKMKKFYNQNQDLTTRIYKWLDVSGLLAFLLTGHVGIDRSLSSRTLLVNINTGEWDDELVETSEIPREHLPKIVDCGVSRGMLKEEISKITGISRDVIVTTAGQDHITASYAVGVHARNKILNSSGTSEAILWTVDKTVINRYLSESPKVFQAGFHCIPGKYYILSGIPTGSFCIDWLINKIFKTNHSILKKFEYRENHVLFFPYLRGIFDKSELGGTIFNLRDYDDHTSIISAVLESMAFEVRLSLENLEKLGLADYEIIASGGGTRLKDSLQIKSNILKIPIKAMSIHESTALGAAMVAKIASDDVKDWSLFFKDVSKNFDFVIFYPKQGYYFEEKYQRYLELRKKIYDL